MSVISVHCIDTKKSVQLNKCSYQGLVAIKLLKTDRAGLKEHACSVNASVCLLRARLERHPETPPQTWLSTHHTFGFDFDSRARHLIPKFRQNTFALSYSNNFNWEDWILEKTWIVPQPMFYLKFKNQVSMIYSQEFCPLYLREFYKHPQIKYFIFSVILRHVINKWFKVDHFHIIKASFFVYDTTKAMNSKFFVFILTKFQIFCNYRE